MATIIGGHNVTTLGNFIPDWTADAQMYASETLVMGQLVKNETEGFMNGAGDSMIFPLVTKPTANDVQPGQSVVYQGATEGSVTLNINKHKEASYFISDAAQTASLEDVITIYTKAAGEAIARAIDSDLTGLYSGLSQSVNDYTTTLVISDILDAAEKLDDAFAPESERYFVAHQSAIRDLLAIDTLSEVDKAGTSQGLRDAVIGRLHGFDVYKSQNIVVTSGTQVHNLAFHKDAFMMARPGATGMKLEIYRKPENLGTGITFQSRYGVAEYRDTFAVEVQSVTA